jgi:hypothetical protein
MAALEDHVLLVSSRRSKDFDEAPLCLERSADYGAQGQSVQAVHAIRISCGVANLASGSRDSARSNASA